MAVSAPSQSILGTNSAERKLLDLIRRTVLLGEPQLMIDVVKPGLMEMARSGELSQVEFPAPSPERYSRRLVFGDSWCRFAVIAMTWGPGQRTALHDHSGVWCVEVVVDGAMQVINYELIEEAAGGLCRFEQRETIEALAASAGALLPPFEHHIFSNAGAAPAHTLHVYGGPMDFCSSFRRVSDGWYQREPRRLHYDC